jgi:hypothetical protein
MGTFDWISPERAVAREPKGVFMGAINVWRIPIKDRYERGSGYARSKARLASNTVFKVDPASGMIGEILNS